MEFYSINELRSGFKVIFDNEPCMIIDNEFVKPGKGQAFSRIRLRKLLSGKVLEKTFKSGDVLEVADIINASLTYLYNDGTFWYFMSKKNFEQTAASSEVVGDTAKWLVEQAECILTLWNKQPIAVTPPNFVELKIIETSPYCKGDTANSNSKYAKLNTGATIKVPLFIQVDELIKVDTRSGTYASRIK